VTVPDPAQIIDSLTASGWQVAGYRTGAYVRLAWPDTPNRSLLIPVDRFAPEFENTLRAALRQLEAAMLIGQAAAKALLAFQPDVYAQYAHKETR
jgi:hypothetical protein